MWSFATPLSLIVVVVTGTAKNERTISAFHVSAFSICAYTLDTFDFSHFPYPPQFVLQQAGFMTSVQGLLGKLGTKKGGGKKVSTVQ